MSEPKVVIDKKIASRDRAIDAAIKDYRQEVDSWVRGYQPCYWPKWMRKISISEQEWITGMERTKPRRIDSAGRDVTDLPGLWDGGDTHA